MHLTVITGASRGLGLAVTAQRLQRGHHVLALARGPVAPAAGGTGKLEAWPVDLADAAPVAERLMAWLAALPRTGLVSATLINNAGVVSSPAPLSTLAPATVAYDLRVGLEAAALLTGAFLQATAAWGVPRKVLLVSSGLGRRAMAGSATYCAAKAGMDHLARAVALEEAATPDGARIVSLAPGIIDTDMQLSLRSADRGLFPEGARFADFKAGGQLDSPEAAATKLLRYLDRPDFGSQPVGDVRDA
jgi:benzil reductase ((S)-benzoin forming)